MARRKLHLRVDQPPSREQPNGYYGPLCKAKSPYMQLTSNKSDVNCVACRKLAGLDKPYVVKVMVYSGNPQQLTYLKTPSMGIPHRRVIAMYFPNRDTITGYITDHIESLWPEGNMAYFLAYTDKLNRIVLEGQTTEVQWLAQKTMT